MFFSEGTLCGLVGVGPKRNQLETSYFSVPYFDTYLCTDWLVFTDRT